MNAPFGGTWEREKAERDIYGRFTRYGIPSKSHGDMAFVLHAVALKENGKAAMVVPHGVLFRGAADQEIREALIHEDLIEAVITLPSNLFLGTGIPVAILLLNKNKDEQKRGKYNLSLPRIIMEVQELRSIYVQKTSITLSIYMKSFKIMKLIAELLI